MAVVTKQADSKLKLVFNAGLDENNRDIMKNKTYANIKSSITNEELFELGVAIAGLQEHQLMNVVRSEEFQLMNES